MCLLREKLKYKYRRNASFGSCEISGEVLHTVQCLLIYVCQLKDKLYIYIER